MDEGNDLQVNEEESFEHKWRFEAIQQRIQNQELKEGMENVKYSYWIRNLSLFWHHHTLSTTFRSEVIVGS